MSSNLMKSYSSIINAERYNELMNNHHLYISESDQALVNFINSINPNRRLEVVELGCGPIRMARKLAKIPHIKLTAVDIDKNFCTYAKEAASKENLDLQIINDNVLSYQHGSEVDIFCSSGLHHHISKIKTQQYLSNIYNQLSPNGYYILIDEFVPDYKNEDQRRLRLVIWYSHIIADAENNGHVFLAREEAKTLLDDLAEGAGANDFIKTNEKLDLVKNFALQIDELSKQEFYVKAEIKAKEFLKSLELLRYEKADSDDYSMLLSRRDFKICDRVLREEVSNVGFIVESVIAYGPIENVGGLVCYQLKKI